VTYNETESIKNTVTLGHPWYLIIDKNLLIYRIRENGAQISHAPNVKFNLHWHACKFTTDKTQPHIEIILPELLGEKIWKS